MPPDQEESSGSAFHPTTTSVSATFLDILFGVLLGIIVFEYPVKELADRSIGQLALFNAMYFALLLKFLLHWWGIRSDIAVFYQFLHYRPGLSNYLLGLAAAFGYFLCIRLLVVWLENPVDMQWALHGSFVLLGVFKIFDTVSNLAAVPALVKRWLKKAELSDEKRKKIREWYEVGQPRIVRWYFVSVPFLLSEPFLPPRLRFCTPLVYLVVEACVETNLFRRRWGFWRALNPA